VTLRVALKTKQHLEMLYEILSRGPTLRYQFLRLPLPAYASG
jgi:hypothetical protein